MKIGYIAPNFRLRNGKEYELELRKNLNEKVLLVFNTEDNSQACSTQLAVYN